MKINWGQLRSWAPFAIVLVVALAISWWSLFSLAIDFYHIPKILAAGISIAFDGAALFVADLSAKYARSEDSAFGPRMATYAFVAASVYLNVMHASLLFYGIPGMVLFGAPPIIAGILFELYLKYIHRMELRQRGRVAKSMPIFGKLSWMVFPWKTTKGFKKVVLFRLNEVVTSVTEQGHDVPEVSLTRVTVSPIEDMSDKAIVPKAVTMSLEPVPVVTDKRTIAGQSLDKDVPELHSGMSVASLVSLLWRQGVTDRTELQRTISDMKGTTVPRNTINKAVARLDNVPGQ
jgi:hypothetical protein